MLWTRRFAIYAIGCAMAVSSALGEDIVVYHNWSSPAEMAALNVLRGAVEARGHRWVPLAIPHDGERNVDVPGLIAAGATPHVFLQSEPDFYRALDKDGRVLHLDAQFAASGVLEHMPQVVRDAITIDGAILKTPATIHADAMIYYSRAVAEASGVDPQSWTSLDDMWADFDAVRAAGFYPIAMGAQPWQIGYLAHSLVASLAGPGVYAGLYGEVTDPMVLDDPSLLDVFAWLRRFQQEADDKAYDRDWNIATNMVINGEALLQVQGDWMKGEWRAAGRTETEDYGCRFIPGAARLPVTVDSWGLLGGVSSQMEEAERAFADAVVDKAVQARFAAAKGSTPVRLDVGESDGCSHTILQALYRPDFAVPTPHLTADQGWLDAIWGVTAAYWNEPSMTPDQGVASLKSAWAAL